MNTTDAKKNYLKAILFEHPDYIPMSFQINAACYFTYNQSILFDLMEEHKFLFPDFIRPKIPFTPALVPINTAGKVYCDDFGCGWETSQNGITGTVTRHPLENWNNLDDYVMPDFHECMGIGKIDWEQERISKEKSREAGNLTAGGLRHGHTFMQLCDLRGYRNLMYDMADGEPELLKLINALTDFNLGIINNYTSMKVDVMTYAEDLGMQIGPMISPVHFRKYIKPSYEKIMRPAKEKGILIHMHSDGDIRLLIDDILDGGVNIINLQDLVNGIDWIAERLTGKVCVDLDIDRQNITYSGTPGQIDALIREEVTKLGNKQGGLTMVFGLYPGVPYQSIKALMDAMEKYSFFYS